MSNPDEFRYGRFLLPNLRSEKSSPLDSSKLALLRKSLWQIMPLVGEKLLHDAKECAACPRHEIDGLSDEIRAVQLFSQIQGQLLSRLVHALESTENEYVFLKGSACRLVAYPKATDRTGHDIDLAVRKPQIHEMELILEALGFERAQWNTRHRRFFVADASRRSGVEAKHYELGFWVRRQVVTGISSNDDVRLRRYAEGGHLWHTTDNGAIACYVTVDVHHALALDIPADAIIDSSQRVEMKGGVTGCIPRLPWMLFYAVYKLYWEGVHNYQKGLYQYADVARLLQLMTHSDWGEFDSLVKKFNLSAGAFYVLNRIVVLGQEASPDGKEFLCDHGKVCADQLPLSVNDYGDCWPKVIGRR